METRCNEENCQCCKTCEDCVGFQKILDLKNAGLTIFRHTNRIDEVDKTVGLFKRSINTRDDIFIIHNTKDTEVKADECISEIDQAISCARCRELVQRAKKYLRNVPLLEKKDIISICEHCRQKKTQKKCFKYCLKCHDVLKKYQALEGKQITANEQIKTWLTHANKFEDILTNKSKKKTLKCRSYSELYLNNICETSFRATRQLEVRSIVEKGVKLTESGHTIKKDTKSETAIKLSDPEYMKPKSVLIRADSEIPIEGHISPSVTTYVGLMGDTSADANEEEIKPTTLQIIKGILQRDTQFPQEKKDKISTSPSSLRRPHSEEDIFYSLTDHELDKNFSYIFPKEKSDKIEPLRRVKTSAELIFDTQERLRQRLIAEKDKFKAQRKSFAASKIGSSGKKQRTLISDEEGSKKPPKEEKSEESKKSPKSKKSEDSKKSPKSKKSEDSKKSGKEKSGDSDKIKKVQPVEQEPKIDKEKVQKEPKPKKEPESRTKDKEDKLRLMEEKKEKQEQLRKEKEEKQAQLRKEKEEKQEQLRKEKEEKQRAKQEQLLKEKEEKQRLKELQKKEEKVKDKENKNKKPDTVQADDNQNTKKQLEVDLEALKMAAERKKIEKDEATQKLKALAEAKEEKNIDEEKPKPKMPHEVPTSKELHVKNIRVRKPSPDDLILQLVRLRQTLRPKDGTRPKRLSELNITPLMAKEHNKVHKSKKRHNCAMCIDSDLELDVDNILNTKTAPNFTDSIVGNKILKFKYPLRETIQEEGMVPILFKSLYNEDIAAAQHKTQTDNIAKAQDDKSQAPVLNKFGEQEPAKGIIRYALSDRSFIDKGWTMLPTEKVVRKMNVYRMRPAHPEFDWFERNKNKRLMLYDTGEKLAEFNDNGRGRWFYRNSRVALDYYDAEEMNAQQRFVIYGSGEPDERGRPQPVAILATFDYLGNGVVFDHTGKIRLKYNQTEGVVLDRNIGPVSHWKWHTLNDPPVLQQVMIDTQMAHKDPEILKLGGPADDKARPDNEEMLAIEFDNFIKEKSKKLSQKFKPFQIRTKALKINENFSLKVLDQANIYLIFRDGTTNIKMNIGMILDHQEIVDTDTAEVGEVSNNLERFPARTDSLAGLQRSVAYAQRVERLRVERERRLRHPEPSSSADKLISAASRPLKPKLLTVRSSSTLGADKCKCICRKQSTCNVYYDTRFV